MFKRMMVLGAVASALVFTGCQSRSRQDQDLRSAPAQTTQGTGGSGVSSDSSIPGSSNTLGGTRQDETRPGTELGGTGSSAGSLDNSGTGGSGSQSDQHWTG